MHARGPEAITPKRAPGSKRPVSTYNDDTGTFLALFTSADPTLSGPAVRALPLCFPMAKTPCETSLTSILSSTGTGNSSEKVLACCVTCPARCVRASQPASCHRQTATYCSCINSDFGF